MTVKSPKNKKRISHYWIWGWRKLHLLNFIYFVNNINKYDKLVNKYNFLLI